MKIKISTPLNIRIEKKRAPFSKEARFLTKRYRGTLMKAFP